MGENFRFGAKARGDAEMLASRAEFETRVVPLVEVDGEMVSSSRIRALVAAGDVEGATRCLGAPFLLEGEVVEGDERGATLGFPTANIVPDDDFVVPGPRRLRRVRERAPGGGQRRRSTDLRDRARAAGRGVPDRLRRRPLRADPADRVHRRLRGEKRFAGGEELIAQMQLTSRRRAELCASFHAVAPSMQS